MSFLAIDLGSSRCKAVAFSERGETIARAVAEYRPEFPRPAFAEIDPEEFWNAVCRCSQAVASQSQVDPVRGICLSSHGETFVPVDSHGACAGRAILNIDFRAAGEARRMAHALGRRQIFGTTGLIVHPMYPAPKILWLREHQPDIFKAAVRFATPTDWILMRLGLPPYIDYSLASRFLAFDVRKKRWSEEILDFLDLPADCLPVAVPAGTIAGGVDARFAGELGLAPGTRVIVGGHDQPVAALGVGAISPGRVSDSIGTYECILVASDQPSLGDAAFSACLNSYCHVVPGQFVTLAFFPSGIMTKWFHDLLFFSGPNGSQREDADSVEHYSELESECPPGPTGLCITPHLIGTCNPDFNPRARGAIVGLHTGSSRSEIYKGILEGLACELTQLAECLAASCGEFHDIYATGGGSRSRLGLRLRASLSGCRIHLMQSQEAVCLGGAILTGVALGVWANISEAVQQVVREKDVIQPDPDVKAAYTEQSRKYRLLYSALAPIRNAGLERFGEENL